MKKIRTLVVDDEPLARARIVKLLEQYDFISLAGECKNGSEALRAIADYKPDLVFLDIQMPDFSGFDLLEHKELHPLPFIIFVTAYGQYALKAFDVHAVDYLLKPYDDERFARALNHARQQISRQEDALLHQKMARMFNTHQQEQEERLEHFEVREKGRVQLVSILDIHFIEAEGNYLKLHTSQKYHLVRQTMQAIEEQLDPGLFLRIHRSVSLNLNFIREVAYLGNNQYAFTMKGGQRLISSRSYRDAIHGYLDNEQLRKRLDF
ncbi:MAG: response regulator transcription factor [Phaeodactylibacter sp.]|nr:response regulator transcription factor [Phaeodactylibacter sp.]MCB9274108.1 response regulator transcription factor [Lewinellaceae bacterium]